MKNSSTFREVRSRASAQPFAVRTLANGQKQISGYAIVWNSPSADLGGFIEVCDPGMLSRTLRENPDVLALRDHKQELLLGRTTAGTLELKTDSTGLAFTITLPNGPTGQDAAEAVARRDLTGCSFGFSTVEDSWVVDSDGNVVRTLLDVDLFEISITSFPAYQDTSVTARSRAAEMRSQAPATRDDDDDDDDDDDCDPETDIDCDDDDEESTRCSCRCERCNMGDCANCYSVRCTERSCRDAGCPSQAQDEARADSLRVRQLFAHRMTL